MHKPTRIRLWPVSAILGLLAVAQCYLWLGDTGNRQWTVMQSIGIGLIAALLLVVWALAFSKFQGRVKR
ncbi:MAG: hypothetical protein VX910_08940, partial [Candidatus Latescibacterota bacterium]|nr:hypothetical protein [Candidatus Latescibacterota bacterium]